jgi:hypothetical protein
LGIQCSERPMGGQLDAQLAVWGSYAYQHRILHFSL